MSNFPGVGIGNEVRGLVYDSRDAGIQGNEAERQALEKLFAEAVAESVPSEVGFPMVIKDESGEPTALFVPADSKAEGMSDGEVITSYMVLTRFGQCFNFAEKVKYFGFPELQSVVHSKQRYMYKAKIKQPELHPMLSISNGIQTVLSLPINELACETSQKEGENIVPFLITKVGTTEAKNILEKQKTREANREKNILKERFKQIVQSPDVANGIDYGLEGAIAVFKGKDTGIPDCVIIAGPTEVVEGQERPSSYTVLTVEGDAFLVQSGTYAQTKGTDLLADLIEHDTGDIYSQRKFLLDDQTRPVIYFQDRGRPEETSLNALYVGQESMKSSQRGDGPFVVTRLDNKGFEQKFADAKKVRAEIAERKNREAKESFDTAVKECKELGDKAYGRVLADQNGNPTAIILAGSNEEGKDTFILTDQGLTVVSPKLVNVGAGLFPDTDGVLDWRAEFQTRLESPVLQAIVANKFAFPALELIQGDGEISLMSIPIRTSTTSWELKTFSKEKFDIATAVADARQLIAERTPFSQPDKLEGIDPNLTVPEQLIAGALERNRLAQERGCMPYAIVCNGDANAQGFILATKPLVDGIVVYARKPGIENFLQISSSVLQGLPEDQRESFLQAFEDVDGGQLKEGIQVGLVVDGNGQIGFLIGSVNGYMVPTQTLSIDEKRRFRAQAMLIGATPKPEPEQEINPVVLRDENADLV